MRKNLQIPLRTYGIVAWRRWLRIARDLPNLYHSRLYQHSAPKIPRLHRRTKFKHQHPQVLHLRMPRNHQRGRQTALVGTARMTRSSYVHRGTRLLWKILRAGRRLEKPWVAGVSKQILKATRRYRRRAAERARLRRVQHGRVRLISQNYIRPSSIYPTCEVSCGRYLAFILTASRR